MAPNEVSVTGLGLLYQELRDIVPMEKSLRMQYLRVGFRFPSLRIHSECSDEYSDDEEEPDGSGQDQHHNDVTDKDTTAAKDLLDNELRVILSKQSDHADLALVQLDHLRASIRKEINIRSRPYLR